MNTCWRCDRDFEYDSFSDGMEECEPCHLQQSIELLQVENQRLNKQLDGMSPYICELQEKTYHAESSAKVAEILRKTSEKKAKSLQTELDSEREGLTSWMRSRRAQQEQLFTIPRMSQESKRVAEIEIGFIDRYLAVIAEGKHRNNNPMVSAPDPREFKSLRMMEREDIVRGLETILGQVRKEMTAAKPGGSDHTFLEGKQAALQDTIEKLKQ